MKSRYMQFRLAAVILLNAILVSFAVTIAASAQAQPGGESTIRFLTGKDDALSYEYNISAPLRVAIANFGTETVTVEANLVNMGFRKDPGQIKEGAAEPIVFLTATEVFTPPDSTDALLPGSARVLEFVPKPGVQLKSGTYSGFLNVKNLKNNELIYMPLQVTVPITTSKPAQVEIEILNAGPLSYDYNDLKKGLDHIAIAIHNKGKDKAELRWEVLTDLIDNQGKPVKLSFPAAPTPTMAVKSGEVAFLDLALAEDSKTIDDLQHGQYNGFVVLTDQNGDIKYAAFALPVPSASLAPTGEVSYDIVGIDASTPLKVDYSSLLNNEKTIAVAVENKGKEAIKLEGEIVLENLPDKSVNFVLKNSPVSAEPGKVAFLNFELVKSTVEPKIGTYKGYMLITAQEGGPSKHAPLILAVPSEGVVTQETYLPYLVEKVQSVSRSISYTALGQELELGIPALVLLILFLGWVFSKLFLLHARGRPGPVAVGPMENATGDDKQQVKGLDALMRDWLEDVGLRSGQAKPFDAVATAVGPLLSTATVPAAQGFSFRVIFDALVALISPTIGHKVVNTLRKRTGSKPYELVFEIIDVRTNETTKIAVAMGDTPESAVKEAASMIYHHIMMGHPHVSRGIPPWERFSTSKSILQYQQAQQYKESGDKVQALKNYEQAALTELNNVPIRQGVIAIHEGDDYLKTVVEYLKIVWLWPELLETRHRLAANLTFVDKLVDQWKKNKTGRQDLYKLLKTIIEDPKEPVFASSIKKQRDGLSTELEKYNKEELTPKEETQLKMFFLRLAKCQRDYLQRQLWWPTRAWKWLVTWNPAHFRPGERHYLGLWVVWFRYWGEMSRTFRNVVELAECCVRLRQVEFSSPQQNSNGKNSLAEQWKRLRNPAESKETLKQDVERIVRPDSGSNENWEVHYTAACFYALAIKLAEQEKEKSDLAKTAVEHLNLAVRDPQFAKQEWLFDTTKGDPDLTELRLRPEYINWKCIVRPGGSKASDEISQKELDDLCYAWDVLAAGAANEAKAWKNRGDEIRLWTEVHTRDVNTWCRGEKELWRALLAWARKPGDEHLYTKFIDKTGAKPPAKTTLGCSKGDIQTHKEYWTFVAKRAEVLLNRWRLLERATEAHIHGETTRYTLNDVDNWADKAYEVWLALEDWAENPSESDPRETFKDWSK